MTTLRGAQLIYSRVESEYSPQRKPGYQIVYRSPSLSADEASLIERRVQCFQPPRPSDDRLQYFLLPSGKAVISRTVQITPDPEITDRTRRLGAFLAHCVILNPAEFAAVGNNPFALFEAFPFLDDPALMVEDYVRAPSVEEPAQINVDVVVSFESQWQEDEAFNLLSVALQAEDLVKSRRGILLVGSSEDIQEALRTAIMRLDPSRRLPCSFDTCVDRCMTQTGTYWAMGVAQRQAISGGIAIDVAARRIQQPASGPPTDDLYLSWLRHASSRPETSSQARAYGPTIQRLATAFAQRRRPDTRQLDYDACTAFVAFHGKRIWAEVEAAFAASLGKSLARSLCQYLQDHQEEMNFAELLAGAAAQRYELNDVSESVLEWLISEHPDLKDSDWKTLGDLATGARNTPLRFLAIVSSKKVDHRARAAILESMSPSAVRELRNQLAPMVPPALFISSSHAVDVIESLPAGLSSEELVAIVEMTLDSGAGHVLDELTPRVATLDADPVHELIKLTRKRSEVPDSFRDALEARRKQLPQRLWPF